MVRVVGVAGLGTTDGRITRLSAVVVTALILAGCAEAAPPADIDYADLQGIAELRIDNAERAVDCLADKGFPGAIVLPDGTTQAQVPAEQADRYNLAMQDCAEQLCPTCGSPTDDQLSIVYDLALASKECLAAEGFPTSDAPSLQTYIDRYRSDMPWSPHAEAARPIAESDRSDELRELCPDPLDALPYWSSLTG